MRNFLSPILYKDNSEKGALFGLSLLTIGNWLYFTIFFALLPTGVFGLTHIKMNSNCISKILIAYFSGVAVLTIYSLFLILRFYFSFWKNSYKRFFTKCIWGCIAILLTALLSTGSSTTFGVILGVILALVCIFPISLIKKVKYYYIMLWLFSVILGSICIIYTYKGLYCYMSFFDALTFREIAGLQAKSFYFSDIQWVWLCIAGIILLLISYFAFAKMLAIIRDIKVKDIFNLPIKILWVMLIASYFINLGMALYESKQAAIAIKNLEERFGKPLTAEALSKAYYRNQKSDAKFWQKTKDELNTLTNNLYKNNYYNILTYYPDKIQDKTLKVWNNLWQENVSHINSLDKLFENKVPRPEREFKTGELINSLLPELSVYRSFCSIQLLRLNLAIKNKDIIEVQKSLKNLRMINKISSEETSLIGSLVWIAMENIYLDNGIINLLKSKMLTDNELNKLKRELEELELLVPIIHEQALYSEVIFSLDCCKMNELGKGRDNINFPLAPFRFVFPQFWWHFAMEKRNLMTCYNVKDFTYITKNKSNKFYFSEMILPALEIAGYKFKSFSAKIQVLKTLIRAEEIRRKTGSFPENLDNLPIDPFTNKPIYYRKGKFNYKTKYARERKQGEKSEYSNDDKVKMDYKNIEVDGIQVWSVGKNKINEIKKQKEFKYIDDYENPDDIIGELFF